MTPLVKKRIAARIEKILRTREVGKTMCPSEALPPGQRTNPARMTEVREVAAKMAKAGKIEITQKGIVRNEGPWVGPMRLRLKKSTVPFDYAGIDFRKQPELYRVARGEQGVLSVEPYKSELLPLWRFKTPEIAKASASSLRTKFDQYRREEDFVGMDMARKFIQMGFTRARRYANHRSGKKYVGAVPTAMKGRSGAHGRKVAALDPDPVKARAAAEFKKVLQEVEADEKYLRMREDWQRTYG